MDRTYWHKQTPGQPLFPELLWSRPENKQRAGKLLIVGGNLHGFAAVAEAYGESARAGVGVARVLLPDALQKTVGRIFPEAEFASSTPSGSFAQKSLADILAAAAWADGVLLAGDFGRNSETAILLESLAEKYPGQLTIAKDAADYFTGASSGILGRAETTLVISLAQLRKLATTARFRQAFTFDMDLLRLVDALHEFTASHRANIVVKHLENIFVASGGRVSSTNLPQNIEIWRAIAAARASVWWLQNPDKAFEALTSATLPT